MKTIRQAQTGDLLRIDRLFKDIIQANENRIYKADWHFGMYPDLLLLQHHILKGTMYLLEEEGEIKGVIVLNNETSSGYAKAKWSRDLLSDEYSVIHLLAVKPDQQKRGYGRYLLDFAIDKAKREGKKQIRLDVYSRNVPAARFYLRNGFRLIDSVYQRYEKTNWKYSNFFEKDLKAE